MRGVEQEKQALRQEIRAALAMLALDDRAARSNVIRQRVLDSDTWKTSEHILLFAPMRAEPDISQLRDAAAEAGKEVVTIPSDLRDEAELLLGHFPQLVLVPGLAFSPHGQRLGRGGGFYDRLLSGRGKHGFKMGICFSFQLRPSIPSDPHDISVDCVISD
jgi:5-formyltetrahydrofolate cyclo-ligase